MAKAAALLSKAVMDAKTMMIVRQTLLQVKVQVLEPTDSNRVLKFTCDTGACTLGRGGLYELVQYFRNKLCPIAK